MGEVYEIHHVCVHAKDLDESIAFYRDMFGFTLVGRESSDVDEYAMLKLGTSRLELIQPKPQKESDFGDRGSIAHIGLGVHDIEDKDAPLGGLRAVQMLGPADEHINLYEWKREI